MPWIYCLTQNYAAESFTEMLMSERETECECRRRRIYRLLVGMIGHPFGVDKWVVSCNQIVVVWRCLVNVSMFVRWKAGMVYPYLSASVVRFSRRGARSLPLYGMHNTISGWSAYAHQRYSSLIFLIERIRGFTRMRYTNLLTYLFTYLLPYLPTLLIQLLILDTVIIITLFRMRPLRWIALCQNALSPQLSCCCPSAPLLYFMPIFQKRWVRFLNFIF